MLFGIALPNIGTASTSSRLAILDTALSAESLGFHSVWLSDHIALPEADAGANVNLFEAMTTLGYLAASTTRIRLGISSLVLPQRSPVEVARQLATLDLLSNGRILVAVGVGWSAGEYAALGQNFHDRGKRMEEAVRVLRTLWRGSKVVSFRGKYYNFPKVVFGPPCVQHGGPKLWIGGDSTIALNRSVLHADGWHPNARSVESLTLALVPILPLLANRPFDIVMRLPLTLQKDPSKVSLYGSGEELVAQIREYQQAGLTGMVIDCDAETQARRSRMLEGFARAVLPAF
jgi:probable F420-dependent oxidoreductase